MSSSSKGYQFTLSGNTVQAVYEVERGRVKFEGMDSDETWSFDGTNVIKTEWDHGRMETTTYSDVDGDGLCHNDFVSGSGSLGSSTTTITTPVTSSFGENGYQFDIDANGLVTAAYQVRNGRVTTDRIDWNESWTFDGLDVTKTETKFGKVGTSIYTDINQDGIFQKEFELDVQTGANLRTLETYQFSLADGSAATGDFVIGGDAIAGMMELGRRGWKVDRIDANETLQVVEVNGDSLILQSKTQWNGTLDFGVFRDDDNDGLWTKIADGETLDSFVTMDGQVDLVGIVDVGLLQAADALIA